MGILSVNSFVLIGKYYLDNKAGVCIRIVSLKKRFNASNWAALRYLELFVFHRMCLHNVKM